MSIPLSPELVPEQDLGVPSSAPARPVLSSSHPNDTAQAAAASVDIGLEEEIARRMTARYVANLRQTGVVANLGTALLFAGFFWHHKDAAILACLAVVFLLGSAWSSVGRWPMDRLMRQSRMDEEQQILLFASACSLAYGASAFVLYSRGDAFANAVLVLGYVMALHSTASGTFWLKRPMIAACSLMGGGIALRFALEPDFIHRFIATGVVFFTAMQVTFAMQAHRMQAESIRQLILNERLAARLDEQARLADAASLQAERASLEKSRFLAAASHDLRQPLHAVCLLTDLVSTAHRAEDRHDEQFSRLARSVFELSETVDAILDLSRLDAGDEPPRQEPVRVADMIAVLHRRYAARGAQKGLALRFFHRGQTVLADRRMLERLLGNLVDNAIKYTDAGGILVAARTVFHQGQRQVRFEVRDSGVGIAPALHDQVFEEFFQVGNAARDRKEGLGLGLSIVHRMARAMDASVGLRSAPGAGSTFWVRLRSAPPSASDDTPEVRGAGDLADLRGVRALVVDNEWQIVEAASAVLTRAGARVTPAATSQEALAAPGDFDVAVLDYRLRGEMTGVQLARVLRERLGERLAILIITGDRALPDAGELRQAGLQVLFKPLRAAAFTAAVAQVLGRR
ncbi:hybrid sensor histidine kinase/response regulator [Ramlibacter humi]|uniref:histidine kinase n=1 Tax=Ramlibacter humi TaxID=2530451 RepID=A0A4Z0BNE0_9BURK|nr:hybrid sensor histidine kinase/response regulator [Ramlibacter humi]TFZ00282.1 response regulator [Ramlibacter humi]